MTTQTKLIPSASAEAEGGAARLTFKTQEITADVELPSVILRQGNQALTLHTEEQLCELLELIEECFTFFDAARQPKAQQRRPNGAGELPGAKT